MIKSYKYCGHKKNSVRIFCLYFLIILLLNIGKTNETNYPNITS